MNQPREFYLLDEHYDYSSIVAILPSDYLERLRNYGLTPNRYRIFYYLYQTEWMIHVHDQHTDEQMLMRPTVLSVAQPFNQPLIINETYF